MRQVARSRVCSRPGLLELGVYSHPKTTQRNYRMPVIRPHDFKPQFLIKFLRNPIEPIAYLYSVLRPKLAVSCGKTYW